MVLWRPTRPTSCCCSPTQLCPKSLWPHGLQQARLVCPSPSPGACSNSCPLSHWCHLAISSSIIPFSSCLQSFPTSGSFLMSWLFTPDGQSIGVSASASVLPMSILGQFPLGLPGLISLQSKGLSRVFFRTTVESFNSSVLSLHYGSTFTSIHEWENHSFDYMDFCRQSRYFYFLTHCLVLS